MVRANLTNLNTILIVNIFSDIEMDLIKQLVRDIKAKDEENFVFEMEKCELEDNVVNQEKHINKKIKSPRNAFRTKETIWREITEIFLI